MITTAHDLLASKYANEMHSTYLGSSVNLPYTVKEHTSSVADGVEHVVREKLVENFRKVVKVVEVTEPIETVSKCAPERIIMTKKSSRAPRVIVKEVVIEVPKVEYREVPVEKIVEVPQIREEIITKEVPVTQYKTVYDTQYREVKVDNIIKRNIPVPVEIVADYDYTIPKIIPKYEDVKVPIYVPRFIEVPVPRGVFNDASRMVEMSRRSKSKNSVLSSVKV